MKKYYLRDGTKLKGPFDLEELKNKSISRGTPVWFEGKERPVRAGNIPELSGLFEDELEGFYESKPAKDNTTLYAIIVIVALQLIIGGIVIYINNYKNPVTGEALSLKEQDVSIAKKERLNPEKFLEVDGTFHENYFGIKIKGSITNLANETTFSNARIRIKYYSNEGKELLQKDYTINKIFPPKFTKDFTLEISKVKGADSIAWKLVNASAE